MRQARREVKASSPRLEAKSTNRATALWRASPSRIFPGLNKIGGAVVSPSGDRMLEASLGAPASDEILVDRARRGDRSAIEELFRRHWGVAHRVAFRLLGHEQDAQDATQECMIKALAHLDDFDGRSGFRTWLLRIVTNAAFDAGRKRKRRPSVGLGLADGEPGNASEPAVEDDPALALRRQDLRKALDNALSRISPKQRQTFVLFAEAGLSYDEIARIQDVPIGTVMSRIYYARTKLQSYLDGVDGL
jgi:RNA polymerase sigma-70 factor (ECF subfamily)